MDLYKWGLYGSQDHYFTRSYLTRSINYPRPMKSQFICKHVNSYLAPFQCHKVLFGEKIGRFQSHYYFPQAVNLNGQT